MSEPTAKPAPGKGIRTTEFWLSAAAALVGALLASGAFPTDHLIMRVAGVAALTLSSLGYSSSRGKAKSGAS